MTQQSKLYHALALATQGFHVFPLVQGTKLPLIDEFPTRATRDPNQIRRWWTCPITGLVHDHNIAISTSRFEERSALLVVDVDNKGDKHGNEELGILEAKGLEFPRTRESRTPTGGRHLFYRVAAPVRQGANVLGPGLDVRSAGGYVVAPGSGVEAGEYAWSGREPLADAPAWLIEKVGSRGADRGPSGTQTAPVEIDAARADRRAVEYLQSLPVVSEGERNDKAFKAVATIKDYGVAEDRARELMQEHWKCNPPLDYKEIKHVVRSAYRYGRTDPGAAAPEVQFKPTANSGETSNSGADAVHPFAKLNAEYAYILIGGDYAVLWETQDENGHDIVKYLSPGAFARKFPGQTFPVGKKQVPLATAWMDWPKRRSFDGLCFSPGTSAPPRFYNLWRGFTVQPWPKGMPPDDNHKRALDAFIEHTRKNVCGGSEPLTRWLLGFFAHMVQKPGEKPLVALVFRGAKGVGKNALVERIGYLLGVHFAVVANQRFLTGQFNSHLEHMLFIVFDEAFWSGDKKAEGQLKDLVTGSHHFIERKGYEPYKAANRTRVAILGNEDWIAPASHDERRYAVFDVGEGRKQDRYFFQTMREGMERGGYRLLLRYLLDLDLTGVDLNEAPSTKGLLDQKHASLDIVGEWWLDSLMAGHVLGSDFDGWPERAETSRFRQALHRYAQTRSVKGRLPNDVHVGRRLSQYAGTKKARSRHEGALGYDYVVPPLVEARAAWERYIGHRVEWEK